MEPWSSGICDCCCSSICCDAVVCPCVVIYWNVGKMDLKQFPEIPSGCKSVCFNWPVIAGCTYISGILGALIGGITGLYPFYIFTVVSVFMHSSISNLIRGSAYSGCCYFCEDLCWALCCYSCAMAQEYKQLGLPSRINNVGCEFQGVNTMMEGFKINEKDIGQSLLSF